MADVMARVGGVVYYCDTDSIMTNMAIPTSAQLGGWKLENPPDAIMAGHWVLPKLYQLQFHTLDCPWALYDPEDPDASAHMPPVECKGCKGDKPTKQKMKGVGGRAQTPANWELMVNQGGSVEFERVAQHRAILNSATTAEKIDRPNLSEDGPMLSPVVVTAKKSVRTKYDKRQLLKGGGTIPIHVAA